MTFSRRLALGFGVVLALLAVSGAVTVWCMRDVSGRATAVREAYIRQAMLANQIERSATAAQLQFTYHIYDYRAGAWDKGREALATVERQVADLQKLVGERVELRDNVSAVRVLDETLRRYIAQAEVGKSDRLLFNTARSQLEAGSEDLLSHSEEFNFAQHEALAGVGTEGLASKEMRAALSTITAMAEIDALAREAHRNASVALFDRDLAMVGEVAPAVESIIAKITAIIALKHDAKADALLKEMNEAAARYLKGAQALAAGLIRESEHGRDWTSTGLAMMVAADKVADLGTSETEQASVGVVETMRRGVKMVVTGVAVCLLAGIAVAWILGYKLTRALRGIARALTTGAEHSSAAARQVSESSKSLAEGASAQAAALEETSASLEQMSGVAERNAEQSESLRQLNGAMAQMDKLTQSGAANSRRLPPPRSR